MKDVVIFPLTSRKHRLEAIIDACHWDRVKDRKWWPGTGRRTWYAYSMIDGTNTYLHRFITENRWPMIDHINGNGLDCREENLRPTNHRLNAANRPKDDLAGATSRFKGVHWNSRKRTWAAVTYQNRKLIFLGYFSDELRAALAYNEAAAHLFGEHARLNVITQADLAAAGILPLVSEKEAA